jgi:hypothetical protein
MKFILQSRRKKDETIKQLTAELKQKQIVVNASLNKKKVDSEELGRLNKMIMKMRDDRAVGNMTGNLRIPSPVGGASLVAPKVSLKVLLKIALFSGFHATQKHPVVAKTVNIHSDNPDRYGILLSRKKRIKDLREELTAYSFAHSVKDPPAASTSTDIRDNSSIQGNKRQKVIRTTTRYRRPHYLKSLEGKGTQWEKWRSLISTGTNQP